ncbi:hypothetical protein H4R99_006465 [Coemansia sp. RSA 1722]|nr:hypothetical protein IWW45_005868 [Coemansia sp. RSA 485]KAJ2592252.1 hypothetical protein H4R99_006465 [Coemansia sp. RSA 1722]
MHSRQLFSPALVTLLAVPLASHARAWNLVPREGNLNETQTVSDPTSAWRAFACMVPFTASDNTPLLMLYGGTSDVDAKDPLSVASKGMSELQVFDTNNNKWYAPNTADAPKTGPILPGCGAASGNIWVYDPQYGTPKKASTAVSLLDSVHWSWSAPTEQGQLPVTRFGAAFAYVPGTKAFYMHGGIPLSDNTNTADNPPGIANNVDILSPSTISWAYASNGPARKYHTLCYLSSIDSLVLFGGSDMDVDSYNDVKLLSAKNNIWEYAVSVGGESPAERILHSAVCSEDTMYMFGGLHSMGDDPSDSTVWMLKANSKTNLTWSRAPVVTGSGKSNGPTARAGHASVLYNESMYIYGGIGPSGQDGTMYKLDLKSWEWSLTNVTGSGIETQKEKKAKTAVLIAAIVSSVLGVITIGIAATVIYRLVRRYRRRLAGGAGRHGGSDQSSIDGDERAAAMETMEEHKNNSRRGTSASLYRGAASACDSGAYGVGGVANSGELQQSSEFATSPSLGNSGIGLGPPIIPFGKASHPGLNNGQKLGSSEYSDSHTPVEHHASDELHCGSAVTTPASIATNSELLPSSDGSKSRRKSFIGSGNGNNSGGGRMLTAMREHARSLSTKIVPSRLSVAFSDNTVAADPYSSSANSPVAASRKYRAGTAGSSSLGPRRRSTIIDKQTANEMYGSDYQRRETEYRQAEAINQILLSGQPIPAWLRDAVNQAEIANQEHPHSQQDHIIAAATTAVAATDGNGPSSDIQQDEPESSRRLGIANNADHKR